MPKLWTEENIEFLKQNYNKISSKEIAEKIGTTFKNIRSKARRLGLADSTKVVSRWTIQEDMYVIENYPQYNFKEIAVHLNRGYDATKNRASKLGLCKTINKWTKEEVQYLKNNYSKLSSKEIAEYLGCSVPSVEHKSSRLGLRQQQLINSGKKPYKYNGKKYFYNHNHEFFSIPNLLNSYIAGFIEADGSIDAKKKTLIIGDLNIKDIDWLKCIAKFLTTAEVEQYSRTSHFPGYEPKTSQICRLVINSDKIVSDLNINFNIPERKTFIYTYPNIINFEQQLAFIIGSIDGDGSIIFQMHKQTQTYKGKSKDYIYPSFTLRVLGTEPFVKWCQEVLSKIENVMDLKLEFTHNIYRLSINGQVGVKIFNVLNKINVPKMDRKWKNPELKQIKGLEFIE